MKTREERQRATALMTKCACGNVAPLGGGLCNACQQQDDTRIQLLRCHSVEDLKEFIAAHLMKDI